VTFYSIAHELFWHSYSKMFYRDERNIQASDAIDSW